MGALLITSAGENMNSRVLVTVVFMIIFLTIIPQTCAQAESSDQTEPASVRKEEQLLPETPTEKERQEQQGPPFEEQKQLPKPPMIQELRRNGEYFVDALHGTLSQSILSTATWLDSFFGDERYESEKNESYVRFRYDAFRERTSPMEYKPTVDARLVLPQLQKKTHLVLSGEPAVIPAGAPEPAGTPGERLARPEEQTLSASVHYFFRSTAKESFLARAGMQFHSGSPILFIGPRYRVLFPFTPWDLRFTEDMVWRTDIKWQSVSRFDFERTLLQDLFFRTSAEGIWTQDVDGYIYGLSFLLRQPLDFRRALEYEWINTFQTRPISELEEVDFRVRYRQSIWREWFFFEIAPQCRFPRDHYFHGLPGILFRIEMIFGSNK